MEPDTVLTSEAARILGISETRIRELCNMEPSPLEYRLEHGRRIILRRSVLAYLAIRDKWKKVGRPKTKEKKG